MSPRRRRLTREHGRILSVETKIRGDILDDDALVGATTLVVGDASDFDEDGGWLTINGQVVEYTAADDDEGTITLATGLTAAADDGDQVAVWSTLYEEVVDYQEALVELDGEYDNPEPVVAEVAEGVGDLPEGDRGGPGESCTLLRVSDDEWEVVGVGGRARKSEGLRAEADDYYVLTAADIAAGVATIPLSHRPADEWLVLWWRTVAQEPTEYTINYDRQTITYPLAGFEAAGDRIWVHYAYRRGVKTASIAPNPVTYVGGSAQRGSTSLVLTHPAGLQVGDLILVAAWNNGAKADPVAYPVVTGYNPPLAEASGTNDVIGYVDGVRTSARVWHKVAAAGDVGGTTTVESNGVLSAAMVVYRGVDAAAPSATADASSVQTNTLTAPSVTLTNGGLQVCLFGATTGSPGVIPALSPEVSLTQRAETEQLKASALAADRVAAAGASGARTATADDVDYGWVAFSVAVNGA